MKNYNFVKQVCFFLASIRILPIVFAVSLLASCANVVDQSQVSSEVPIIALVSEGGKKRFIKGRLKYDGRIKLFKSHYISATLDNGEIICEGSYVWFGFGTKGSVSVVCFDGKIKMEGSIYTVGRRTAGPHYRKGFGISIVASSQEKIYIIFGLDENSRKISDFRTLWLKHGGDLGDLPKDMGI